ncbi:MAG: hypothetical protein JWM58_4059 [Rhizobium sp.]|nr:hypothetical protein [Rhizobium sp.]
MARTILHIGAHKTATTYMQKKLAINVDQLSARGIHYDPLEVLRRNFTNTLQDPAKGNSDFIARLRERIKVQHVIVSEENMPGVPGDLVRNGVYYAYARDRLKLVGSLLDITTPEIFMALREYSGFIVSMYCEYIRHREFISFADYFEIYKKSGFSWVKVVGDIVEALPGARVRLWDFSKFRTIENEVYSLMLGQDSAFLTAPEGPVRESFSDAAMRSYEALSAVLSHHEMKGLINPISRALPKGDVHKAFNPLTQEVTDSLKAQYKQDLQAVREKFPSIEFIGG